MNTVLRVLHVASDSDALSDREVLLKRRGYDVVSVVGNSEAMDLLVTDQDFAFAVLDPEINPNHRSRLISWLKVVHPKLGAPLLFETANAVKPDLKLRPAYKNALMVAGPTQQGVSIQP